MTGKKIRVVVVDDSALIRQVLSAILNGEADMEVAGTAADPLAARELIKQVNPDVITLDVEMPKMDGLSFLEKIMRLRPMPVVMVSTLTQAGATTTLKALEMGAVDFVGKPTLDLERGLKALGQELVAKVRMAASAKVRPLKPVAEPAAGPKPAPAGLAYNSGDKIVVIGSSTGGVEALKEVIVPMPVNAPPILITQHMPKRFTGSFAQRLDSLSKVTVHEARDQQRVLPGNVYIAPGDLHLELARSGGHYFCRLSDGPEVSGHKPSVDVLFSSAAESAGPIAVGVILTGMGKDGAQGMMKLKEAGAMTIAQDEATSLVYGMPRVAKQLGGVQLEASLGKMADEILKWSRP